MTSGTIDLPKVGHVLRYVYLFANEQKAGRDEGVKERFVVVIAIDGKRYSVAAITTKGEGRANALPLPAPVATAGGVAGAPDRPENKRENQPIMACAGARLRWWRGGSVKSA